MVRILGRDMSSDGTSVELETSSGYRYMAASEEFLYVAGGGHGGVRRLTHDGTEVTNWEDLDKLCTHPVLAPGGLLFCVLADDDYTQDEIVALDAQTLQPRHRFGLSLLNCAQGMAVVGDDLFVCDTANHRLQVFSLAGEHRRSITGEWKRPLTLCFVKDRLYLVEQASYGKDEEGNLINPLQGRRIFVLSLQGDTLQVYTHPVEGQFFDVSLCCFDKLLAPVRDRFGEFVGVVALFGV